MDRDSVHTDGKHVVGIGRSVAAGHHMIHQHIKNHVASGRRSPRLRRSTGDHIRFQSDFAINVEPHMLLVDAQFYVGLSEIASVVVARLREVIP